MPTPSLKLKPNAKPRVLAGHPWVFANEVEALLPADQDGEIVECRDRADRFLGTGVYNSRSQIVWRRFSRERAALNGAYLRGAVERAVARRSLSTDSTGSPQAGSGQSNLCRRLVWSESDDLPGLVVDQFGDTLVVQIQTAAMEKRSALVGDVLAEVLKPAEIIFRNDAPIRRLEGLPLEVHALGRGLGTALGGNRRLRVLARPASRTEDRILPRPARPASACGKILRG